MSSRKDKVEQDNDKLVEHKKSFPLWALLDYLSLY